MLAIISPERLKRSPNFVCKYNISSGMANYLLMGMGSHVTRFQILLNPPIISLELVKL